MTSDAVASKDAADPAVTFGVDQRGQECHLDAVFSEAVALSASGLLIGASAPFAIPGRYGFSVDYVCRRWAVSATRA